MDQSVRSRRAGRRGRSRGARVVPWGALVVSFAFLGCGGRTGESGGTCDAVTGCGGDIQGSWDIISICFRVPEGTSVMTNNPDCDPVVQRALSLATVTPTDATVEFTEFSYSRSGALNLSASYTFTDACLAAQGLGTASVDTCTQAESVQFLQITPVCSFESGACVCRGSGVQNYPQGGSYRVDGTQILFDGDFQTGPYCVRGNRAILTSAENGVGPETRYSLRRRP